MAHTTETRECPTTAHRKAIEKWFGSPIENFGRETLADGIRYFIIQASGRKVFVSEATYRRMQNSLVEEHNTPEPTLQPIVIDRVQKFRDALGHWQYVMLSNTGGGYREWSITEEQFEKLSYGYMYRAFWDTQHNELVIQPVHAVPKPEEVPEDNRARISRKKVLGELA